MRPSSTVISLDSTWQLQLGTQPWYHFHPALWDLHICYAVMSNQENKTKQLGKICVCYLILCNKWAPPLTTHVVIFKEKKKKKRKPGWLYSREVLSGRTTQWLHCSAVCVCLPIGLHRLDRPKQMDINSLSRCLNLTPTASFQFSVVGYRQK